MISLLVIFLFVCRDGYVLAVDFQWKSIPPLPDECRNGAGVPVWESLYHIGGCCSGDATSQDDPPTLCTSTNVFVYDTITSHWRTAPSLIYNVEGASAVYNNGSLFVFGFASDLATDNEQVQWLDHSGSKWQSCNVLANSKTPVRRSASVVSWNNKIYVIGGIAPNGTKVFDEVLEFDPRKCLLKVILPIATYGRQRGATCATSEGIYYIGGISSTSNTWTDEVVVINPSKQTINPENNIPINLPWPSCARVERHLWVLGNQTDPNVVVMYSFELYLKQWHQNNAFVGLTPLRAEGAYTAISDNLYFIGGVVTQYGTLTNMAQRVNVVDLPDWTPSQEVTMMGTQLNISFTDFTPRQYYRFRLSNTMDCLNNAGGTKDASVNNTFLATFTPTAPSLGVTLCFSGGSCSVSISQRIMCRTNPSDQTTCEKNGCCWDDSANSVGCFVPTANVDSSTLMWVLVSPIQNLTFVTNATPAPGPTEGPEEDAHFSLWVAIALVAGGALLCFGLGVCIRLRRQGYTSIEDGGDGVSGGPYKLVRKLGSGGYGTVFLVQRRMDGNMYALKYIPCSTTEQRQDAIKEFEFLKRLQGHENMIQLIDMILNWRENIDNMATPTASAASAHSGGPWSEADARSVAQQTTPRYCCIITEYYPEGDLKHFLLRQSQKLSQQFIVSTTLQICSLLDYIHNCTPPIIHRDLKPENVLLDKNATRVVVTDFGLARFVAADAYMSTQAGSLPFVAPECWQRHYSVMADMWGVGCIMYAMCTLRAGPHNTRVMFSDATKPGFESEIRRELIGYHQTLTEVVLSLLNMDPHKRPKAREVIVILSSM
eukprot:PhF_6_TR31525/c0_g1_i1/m.46469/K20877/NEK8; NIMA (never in mitosis gene a)-related kinase 8